MMSSTKKNTFPVLIKMTLAAMLLSLALVLPFLTAYIPKLGNALCPMHLPVLLCGFFCGPFYGLGIGFIAPLLRSALFGMPPIYPTGIAMCFELAAYGLLSGLLYKLFPKKKPYIYASLLIAMLGGRLVWGAARIIMYRIGGAEFGRAAFIAGAFTNAVPGIIIQIVLIPVIVMAVKKFR